MMELSACGVPIEAARSGLLSPRLSAVRNLLTQTTDGQPKLIFSPNCKQLIAAMAGKYVYRKTHGALGESYSEEPDKTHPWSDLCDALSFVAMDIDGIGHYGNTGHDSNFSGGNVARKFRVDSNAWEGRT